MKFSIVLFPLDRWASIDDIFETVRFADEIGIGSIGLPEHIVNTVVPDERDRPRPTDVWFDNFGFGARSER